VNGAEETGSYDGFAEPLVTQANPQLQPTHLAQSTLLSSTWPFTSLPNTQQKESTKG
jgi:hypothetical protein